MRLLHGLALVLVPLAITWLSPSLARAAWPHDPNIGTVPLCVAANSQEYPTIASDGAGGAIVTWADARGGNYDIYAQRVNAAGVVQWTPGGVALCAAANAQYRPVIVSDGAGGAIVAWSDVRRGTNSDIYAQRVNGAGVAQWTADGVALCAADSNQTYPAIVSDGAGGAIVSWSDGRNDKYPDVYAQRVSGAGVVQWTANGVALCTAPYFQENVASVSDGMGGAIVSWSDARGGSYWDIYAQRVNGTGVVQWTANGVAVSAAAYSQEYPTMAADGSGGAVLSWWDGRNGSGCGIYAQRVNAEGALQWSADAVEISPAGDGQQYPVIASDGSGGAIVAWWDGRSGPFHIYAQRVSAGGNALWTADGVALCTVPSTQSGPAILPDDAGGAIVTWTDYRSGTNNDIYAQRVNAAGALQWNPDGVALCTAAQDQFVSVTVSDGAGGAIAAWMDYRSGTSWDIYAQRVERFGYLGSPEPAIASVGDVPNDQGGNLTVRWTPSYLDVVPGNALDQYWVWRQVPSQLAQEKLARGARLVEGADRPSPMVAGTLRTSIVSDQLYYWEYVGSQVAHGFAGYSFTVPTMGDSTAAGNPYTVVMVEAEQTSSGLYWSSAPDSGYSVDDLSPAMPALFTGTYTAGAGTFLDWAANTEPDLAGYRVYRGTSASFVPSSSNLIATPAGVGYQDAGAPAAVYKLSAVDVHGNESPFAFVEPSGLADTPGSEIPREVFLAPAAPNPARGGTALRFGLPRSGVMKLVLYDSQGRRVRVLLDEVRPAGTHSVRWDGRDEGGRPVASGLYFVRLSADGRTLGQRLAIVE